jgi:hypothetical protein
LENEVVEGKGFDRVTINNSAGYAPTDQQNRANRGISRHPVPPGFLIAACYQPIRRTPSLYLSAKPAWFQSPWPIAGADLTRGNISGLAGTPS